MSQQFGRDAVTALGVVITAAVETPAVTGNALNPPFGNCKAVINASVTLTVGAAQTSASLRVRRNPSQENVIVATQAALTVVAGNVAVLQLLCTDQIPDGRPVQYQVTVQQAGGAGNGSASVAAIDVTLISG